MYCSLRFHAQGVCYYTMTRGAYSSEARMDLNEFIHKLTEDKFNDEQYS